LQLCGKEFEYTLLWSSDPVWTLFATAEVATREASANVVMIVFMEVSFVSDVRSFVVTFGR
jgi:hypothetical protein